MFRSLVHRARALVVVGLLSCGSIAAAVAAPGDMLFEDNFATMDPSFGEPSELMFVEGNSLVVGLDANEWSRRLYESLLFGDVDVAATVQLDDMQADEGATVGLMFWGASNDDFYMVHVSDQGTYAVQHFTNDRYLNSVPWVRSDAINAEPGATNELRVVTVGNRATISINGQGVATIRGEAPEGGSLVGMFAQAGAEAPTVARFAQFRVVEPAPANSTDSAAADASLIYEDQFATLDPSWGAKAEWFDVRDGQLFVEYAAEQSYLAFNDAAAVDGDIDAAVTATIQGDVGDATVNAVAAIAFWAQDAEHYYYFGAYDNGNVAVYRRVKDRWLTPLAVQAAPAAAGMNLAEGAQLRVVTSGNRATLSLNGVEIGTITGQPPQGYSRFGFFSKSGDQPATVLFDDLTVRQPPMN